MRNDKYYGPITAFIFTFNLIVGTGALALPKAFSITGVLLGIISLIFIAFFSYVCATYVIETLALANLNISKINKKKEQTYPDDLHSEREPLFNRENDVLINDQLKQKIELGEMASLFLGKFGKLFFYACLTLYLYGDLCIYFAAISQTLTDVTCSEFIRNLNDTNHTTQCHIFSKAIEKIHLYRIFLVSFAVIITPFLFYNIQKTWYLQIFTTFARWFAFIAMIGLCISRLLHEPVKVPQAEVVKPKYWDLSHLPSLFGVAVYAFMCHHSIPSLVYPLKLTKLKISNFGRRSYTSLTPTTILLSPARVFAATYLLVYLFYATLSTLAVFAFPEPGAILDLFTLNFVAPSAGYRTLGLRLIANFLALFPALALATTFPILAVTLRNNLFDLISTCPINSATNPLSSAPNLGARICRSLSVPRVRSWTAIALTLVPPWLISWFLPGKLQMMVALTGAYPGIALQCLLPVILVFRARKLNTPPLSPPVEGDNIIAPYESPFKSNFWLGTTLLWVVVCVTLVTFHLFRDLKT